MKSLVDGSPQHRESARVNRIVLTGLALFSVQGMTWLSSLVNVAVLPRFLGAEQFGYGATAWTATAVAALFANFGISNFLIKETARDPKSARNLVRTTVAFRTSLWAAIVAVVAPAIILSDASTDLAIVLALSAVGGWAGSVQEASLAALQGLERLGRSAFLLAMLSLANTGLSVAVLMLGADIIGVVGVSSAVALVGMIVVAIQLRNEQPSADSGRVVTVAEVAAGGRDFFAWELGLKIYGSVDMLILSILVGQVAVGNYAFAYRLISIPVFVTTIATMAVYPSLSASAQSDALWFKTVVSNAARLCVVVTAPMAVGIAALAPDMIDILAGDEFEAARAPMVILAVHIPAVAVHTILGMSLFASDAQARMAKLAWVVAAVTIAANLALIPLAENLWGNGAIGAAIVTLTTEIGMGLLVWRWSWGLIDHAMVLGSIVKTIAACGVMAVVVLPVNAAAGILVAIPAGAVTFGVASLVLGAYSVGEIRQLAAQARPGAAQELASVEA